ncbi:MAG: hypothetical protein JXB34_12350 [Bacteroidales bacterium]|nr:hypothetical protein [Bacteroidales bacterium]
MSKKGNVAKILLSSFGLLFGIIALILSFLPLKIFFNLPAAFLPGFVGFFMGIMALNIGTRNKLKKGLPSATVIVSFTAVFIGIISLFFKSGKVEDDAQFEAKKVEIQQQVEQSTDLQEALEEIELEELEGLEE